MVRNGLQAPAAPSHLAHHIIPPLTSPDQVPKGTDTAPSSDDTELPPPRVIA
jgi:hypothetical protein